MLHHIRRSARVVAVLIVAGTARAAEPGFVQDFNNGTTGGFNSFATLQAVPTGGVGGAGDGYLKCSLSFVDHLGAHTAASQITGTLNADGVTGYSFWLKDVGQAQNLEIHVGVGLAVANFWLSVEGFHPSTTEWREFSVDLTDSSGWVRIQGTGTFQQALNSTDRLLFRHDTPPFMQGPTEIAGDVGLDRVTVLPACVTPAFVSGDAATSFAARAFDGFVDARAESDNGNMVNLGLDSFVFEFSTPLENVDGTPLSTSAFSISDTAGSPPAIASVDPGDGRVVTLHLSDHIAVKQRTTITVNARAQCNPAAILSDSITIGYLPADVDQNGCVSPFDLLTFRTYVNGIAQPNVGVVMDYVDTNRSGSVSPFDLLAFRQLINGTANATQPWSGECLP